MTQRDVPAGWYANPADNGSSERYWDGRFWTDWTRARSMQFAASGASAGTVGTASSSVAEPDDEYIPAGWYPDPDTDGVTARYWDGDDWTERTRASLRPTPGPLAGRRPVAVPPAPLAAPTAEPVAVAAPVVAAAVPVVELAKAAESAGNAADQDVIQTIDVAAHEPAAPAQEVAPQHPVTEHESPAETEHVVAQEDAPEPAAPAEPLEASVSSLEAALPAEAALEDSAEPRAEESDSSERDIATDAAPAGEIPVPRSTAKQGPGSPQAPAAVPSAQRDGFRPLQRLRDIRRRDESSAAPAQSPWSVDSDAIDAFRQLEFNRLELLLGAVWEEAMEGDVASVQAATRLIEIRCRLLGVDVGSPFGDASAMPVTRERAGQ